MRQAAVDERQFVPVTDHIEPGIGKEVGTDGARQMRFQVADTGADFDDAPRYTGIQQRDDSFIKAGVEPAQQRFVLPGIQVAANFQLMLCDWRAHARRRFEGQPTTETRSAANKSRKFAAAAYQPTRIDHGSTRINTDKGSIISLQPCPSAVKESAIRKTRAVMG